MYFSQSMDVYENIAKIKKPLCLDGDRSVFANVYKLICAWSGLKANDILDYCNKLSIKDGSLSACQILFTACVFMELNFIEFDDILNVMTVLKSKKAEITSSLFYQAITEG